MNIHGQSGLNNSKEKQIEDFIKRHKIDVLNCQEINIEDKSFHSCKFISSNYHIISNNAINKFGTATIIRNCFHAENIRMDTSGRAIYFNIENVTLGNVYLHSGTDGVSRGNRETFCAETIPQLLVNHKECGVWGGDLNCITDISDCTNNPASKMSPSLSRTLKTFSHSDCFRSLYPQKSCYSRFYRGTDGTVGASRIDRCYSWGNITVQEAEYSSIAFSDHLAHVVQIHIPDLSSFIPPQSRPMFKISPEVVYDSLFKERLEVEFQSWEQVRKRGLNILEWWEIMVKPGIRKEAINRSRELNKQKRSRLNCLLLKQGFFTKELQGGDHDRLAQLCEVKILINDWYENESRKVILQARVDDVQESERVRIYHHEQHQKSIKRSAILKLDTPNGLLIGHEACSAYLQSQLAALLLHQAELDPSAQEILLAELEPVFTEDDNKELEKPPDKEELKTVLFKSNLNAAPGTDGITGLLYKAHWDILGDPLHQVVAAIHEGGQPTLSQRTCMMVYGSKPKKLSSIKAEDKRRISLLNSDFKLATGLEAARLKKTFNHTLSPLQVVAGEDRRIHHMINKARDCIFAVSKSKLGCALLDLDFMAAFDYQVMSWVLAVLKAKGMSKKVITRISLLYEDSKTIPVVNNVPGRALKNIRGSLRQGCPGSMGWFSISVDALLIFLHRRLQGINICSLPTTGPKLADGTPPQPVTEDYTVYGYADDVKPAVTTMAEFALVEQAVTLFERSSGNHLHRDPVKGKCKVLLLGRWRNTLQQEDIRFPHFKITDSLAMVGVDLTASWQSTRKCNMDEVQARVQRCIGSWRSGKFMPLVSRPFSLNTYCSSKIWYRTASVDMRVGDVQAITSKLKSYCYQDLFLKPSEVLLYRNTEEGGLGLQNVQCKAKANLISTFMQTASSKRFETSLFHSWLYRFHVKDETDLPPPGYTPYYNRAFFETIKEVRDTTPLNPEYMSVKEWYRYLVEKNITKRVAANDDEGRTEQIPCRIEDIFPTVPWSDIYSISRHKGLSPDDKSFLFKLIHRLLPSKERLHHLTPASSPLCPCGNGENETYQHLFYSCVKNAQAGRALLHCLQSYDHSLTEEKSLRVEIESDDPFTFASVSLLATGLALIWENRKMKKNTTLHMMRAQLEASVSIKRKSRLAKLRETASIMDNMIKNFLL